MYTCLSKSFDRADEL